MSTDYYQCRIYPVNQLLAIYSGLCTHSRYQTHVPHKDPQQRKEYQHKYHKEWHQKNHTTRKQQIKERKRKLKQRFQKYKETLSCSRCDFPGKGNPWAMELHHVDPSSKSEMVSYLVSHGYSWERIMEEVDKCKPICANCHRKEHYLEYKFHPETRGSQEPLKRGDPSYTARVARKRKRKKMDSRRNYLADENVRPGPKRKDSE